MPAKGSEFVHRNGRTACMHASGTAYILLYKEDKTPDYIQRNHKILKVKAGKPMPKRPEYQTIYGNCWKEKQTH